MTDKQSSGTVSVSRELLSDFLSLSIQGKSGPWIQIANDLRAILAQPAEQQDEPLAFIQIPKNVEKYGHGDHPDRLKFGKPGQFFANGESPMFDFIPLYRRPAAQAVKSEEQERQGFLVWANDEYDIGDGYELNESNVDVVQNLKGWMARAQLNGIEP